MSGEPKATLGDLYLIPNLLGETSIDSSLPPLITSIVSALTHFVVEDEKSARRFIKALSPEKVIRELSFSLLNEHTKREELLALVAPLEAGISVGVISEAGCPGIADPGADLVARAHSLGARVHPLVGPCSMTLALMASGFNGQRWRFVGYVPIEGEERRETLKALERDLRANNETQILMETPYRNQRLFADLISVCRPDTHICVASALTTASESVRVKSVEEWRSDPHAVPKLPTLFLMGLY